MSKKKSSVQVTHGVQVTDQILYALGVHFCHGNVVSRGVVTVMPYQATHLLMAQTKGYSLADAETGCREGVPRGIRV